MWPLIRGGWGVKLKKTVNELPYRNHGPASGRRAITRGPAGRGAP